LHKLSLTFDTIPPEVAADFLGLKYVLTAHTTSPTSPANPDAIIEYLTKLGWKWDEKTGLLSPQTGAGGPNGIAGEPVDKKDIDRLLGLIGFMAE
jgi:hypothetical protein